MNYYYLTQEKKPLGPLPLEELCRMAESGSISPFVLVAKEGDAAWRTLKVVAMEQGIELSVGDTAGACPTCEHPIILLPDGTLPLSCSHCGRAFRPVEGRENNLWYNFTLALRQYAKFSGRATRQEYWSYVLFSVLLSFVPLFAIIMVAAVIAGIAAAQGEESVAAMVIIGMAYIVNYGLSLFFLLPSYAVWVRRLHDVGWSGKWVLGFILAIVVALMCFLGGAVAGGASDEGVSAVTIILWSVAGCLYISAFVVAIITCVLTFFDSQRGPNKYGPSRKYPLG